ncbi:MAG: hypothetical protein DRJ10_06485 [Bacteroidetes bacterium]|nr:MAG: hypothetical protein DRJ10_06485 [Bacteroidota bacterium]
METTINYKPVHIEMTDDSPQITLDADKFVFKIEGASYPENSYDVYNVVLDWIRKLDGDVKSKLNCDFNFSVLSSASHKMIYEIITLLDGLHKKSNNVTVNWHYQTSDEDLFEIGEDFSDIVDVPFKFYSLEG